MTYLGPSTNDYGTAISVHRCDSCGRTFTVCPAVRGDAPGWDGCMSTTCESYDESRDADKLFEERPWVIQRSVTR